MFDNIYNNSKVLITGHTGFKGSWLALWLTKIGAKVSGIALDPITDPSHFEIINLKKNIDDYRIDIGDFNSLNEIIKSVNPDYVFHLAAQAIVRKSFENPLNTWKTNVLGTLNVIESMRFLKKPCIGVFVTSDKCYLNKEWPWSYRESDELGGVDPYSASKGAAEFVIRSHKNSFLNKVDSNIIVASARAGNVVGGGDWSSDRIVPDCVRAWSQLNKVIIRQPNSTRPWQHVLEPLSGYLQLARCLKKNNKLCGESFNFGPSSIDEFNVLQLVKEMKSNWENVQWEIKEDNNTNHTESKLLKLNCDKAFNLLNWQSTLNFYETVKLTSLWYSNYYSDSFDINISDQQIDDYINFAQKRGIDWAR